MCYWGFVSEPLPWKPNCTFVLHDVVNRSVTDGGVARLDVQKWFVSHAHRHHLLQSHLCSRANTQTNTNTTGSVGDPYQLSSTFAVPLSPPLFRVAWVHRIRAMSVVHVCLTSAVAAWSMKVWFLVVLLLNQISNLSPLFPADSVRPTSAVWKMTGCCQNVSSWWVGPHQSCSAHLEGVFVDENV